MKKSLRDAWAKALRSGEYKQGRGSLFPGKKLCCLGVLCRVAGVENLIAPAMAEIWERAPYDDIAYELVCMNDLKGKTFAEIADWIEQNIPVTP